MLLSNSKGAMKPDTSANSSICTKFCKDAARPRICGKISRVERVMPGKASDMPNAYIMMGTMAQGMLETNQWLYAILQTPVAAMISKPSRTSCGIGTVCASLPFKAEPATRPPTMGTNIQPNAVSGKCSNSMTKCGAEAIYRAKPP